MRIPPSRIVARKLPVGIRPSRGGSVVSAATAAAGCEATRRGSRAGSDAPAQARGDCAVAAADAQAITAHATIATNGRTARGEIGIMPVRPKGRGPAPLHRGLTRSHRHVRQRPADAVVSQHPAVTIRMTGMTRSAVA